MAGGDWAQVKITSHRGDFSDATVWVNGEPLPCGKVQLTIEAGESNKATVELFGVQVEIDAPMQRHVFTNDE